MAFPQICIMGGLGKSLSTELAANVSLQFPPNGAVGEADIGIPSLNLLWNGQAAAEREHCENAIGMSLKHHVNIVGTIMGM